MKISLSHLLSGLALSASLSFSSIAYCADLRIENLDCTSNTNGGALTTDGSGAIICSDDDSGGGGGSSSSALLYGNWFPGNDQTLYILDNNRQSTIPWVCALAPRAGTLKNLYARASMAVGAGVSVTISAYADGDTTLSVTLDNADGTNVVSDNATTVAVSAGELICFKGESFGNPSEAVTFSMEFE